MLAIIAACSGRTTGSGRLLCFDRERHHPEPAVEERRVGGRQFQQPDLPGAQRERGVVRQLAGDAQPRRRRRHRLRPAEPQHQPHRGGVDRVRQRFIQRDLAAVVALEVLRLPVADPHRRVQHGVVGRESVLQRRQPDERLECRAGLAVRVDRAVEVAVAVVASADHHAHRAGRGIQHHDRALARRPPPLLGPSRIADSAASDAICRRWSSVVRTVASRSGGSTDCT